MNGGVEGAHNIDVALHSAVLPVHEYLPRCPGPQRAVSEMTGIQAMRYIADYVHALASLDAVDIVVAHHANLAAVAARIFAKIRRVPYVVFVHGTGIEPRSRGGYSDAVWDEVVGSLVGAAGIVVTTDYVRDALVQPLVELPPDRFLVLPCGVDVTEFQPAPWPALRARYGLPDDFVICPGALTPAKGPQNVVAASVHYADLAPTVFIGGGDLRPRLEAELGDRGVFLGFVTDTEKAALINEATVLAAAPVKREHFGIIYIEAMASGTVPVAYRGGGVDTIITPETGVLCDRDPAALGRAVRKMLEAPERRQRLAAAARRRAVAEYEEAALGRAFAGWLETVRLGQDRFRRDAGAGTGPQLSTGEQRL